MKRSVSRPGAKVKAAKAPRSKRKEIAVTANPKAARLSRRLLDWYDRNRRALPWRAEPGETPDPYRVWLSEIMLQQTTVAAVIPYYRKFIARWPDIESLAAAAPDDVMRMWAGLGYYRRARLLLICARAVVADYGGRFPVSEETLKMLPGFGAYTAAAVAAIAFGQRANVVDGNVERVMARFFAIEEPLPVAKPALRAAAAALLPSGRFGDYAQALMDLGATVCVPRNPACQECPWQMDCRARARGIAGELPRRKEAKAKPMRRAMAFVLRDGKGRVLLRQRPEGGLLGGMMEFPSTPWLERSMPSLSKALPHAPVADAGWRVLAGLVIHVFSHFELEVAVALGQTGRKLPGRWVAPSGLGGEALPSVMRKIARHAMKA